MITSLCARVDVQLRMLYVSCVIDCLILLRLFVPIQSS